MANNASTEILENICQHLSVADLKRARLLCRSFNPAARRYIFLSLLIHLDLNSFRKLSYVSRQPDLARWVQSLHVNDKVIANEHMDFQAWKSYVLEGSNKKLPIASGKGETRESLMEVEFQWHYSQYRYQVETEKRILTGNMAVEWLSDACKCFPNLATISFGGINVHSEIGTDPSRRLASQVRFQDLSPIAQSTLVEREHLLRFSRAKLFLALIKAAESSHARLKTVEGSRIPIEAFQNLPPFLHEPNRMISKLRHLKLHICVDHVMGSHRKEDNQLGRLLANTMMLQTLHLSFENQQGDDPSQRHGPYDISFTTYASLSSLLACREHWPSLQNLKFSAIAATEISFTTFLETHAPTLKSVELCNISIVEPPSPVPPPNIAQPTPTLIQPSTQPPLRTTTAKGSWISIINFMARSLRLQHISLNGLLQSPNDKWIAVSKDAYHAAINFEDALSFQVERYPDSPGRDRVQNSIMWPEGSREDWVDWTEQTLMQMRDASWMPNYGHIAHLAPQSTPG